MPKLPRPGLLECAVSSGCAVCGLYAVSPPGLLQTRQLLCCRGGVEWPRHATQRAEQQAATLGPERVPAFGTSFHQSGVQLVPMTFLTQVSPTPSHWRSAVSELLMTIGMVVRIDHNNCRNGMMTRDGGSLLSPPLWNTVNTVCVSGMQVWCTRVKRTLAGTMQWSMLTEIV